MKKVLFATLLGGFLGIFDGLTSLFTPEVRDQIVTIVIGSTFKGLVAGMLIGAFFAYLILLGNPGHTLNIMLPGSLVGLIVGYTAQKHQP